MKTRFLNKGYLLRITSWENDGDNYRTMTAIVDTLEEAEACYKLCTELFKSVNSPTSPGIGNTMEDEFEESKDLIVEFMRKYPALYGNEELTDQQLIDRCRNYIYYFLGSSEYYECRVVEKCEVFCVPTDIDLEKIL